MPAFAQSLFIDVSFLNGHKLKNTETHGFEAVMDIQILKNKTNSFQLFLPNGESQLVNFKSTHSNTSGGFSWHGKFINIPDSHISFSIVNDAVFGYISANNNTYEIQPLNNFKVKVVELSTVDFPGCSGAEPIENNPINKPITNDENLLLDKTTSDTIQIDIMVLYTPQARDGAGGDNAIKATAQAAVDTMNISANNSLIDVNFTLVHTGLVNYNDTGNSSDDLNWVRNDTQVQQLRTSKGADMTALLTNSLDGCGRGYIMSNPGPGFASFAYQVTRRSCAVGNLSFAHEFGHNMGLDHDPDNAGGTPENASFPWSFGHNYPGNYRTIMSYGCSPGCGRKQYFSNPDVIYLGEPTGIEDERDNARTMRSTASIVKDFRIFVDDIFEDGFD